MQQRLFLFFACLAYGLPAEAITGDGAAWSCEKSAGDSGWSCVSPTVPSKKPKIEPSESDKSETGAEDKPLATSPATPGNANTLPTLVSKPPVVERKPDGWTCNSAEGKSTWNCSLVGPDPKGQAVQVVEMEESFSLLEPAFDFQEERNFTRLKNSLPLDPWQSCANPWAEKPTGLGGNTELREQSPLDIHADYSESLDQETSHFWGNVDVTRADQHLQSEKANFDNVSNVMDAQGSVFYSEETLALFSQSAQVETQTDKARLRDALFVIPSVPLRGKASSVYRDSKDFTRYDDPVYTSCRPGNQDWVVHGSQLKINRDTGKGAVKDAWLEFKGIPVMYVPYMSFPVDNRRLTGFLTPGFGKTEKNGFDLSVPFYWNIAPNYDLLAWGRYLENRGPLFGSKFRWLSPYAKGYVNFEGLPYDSEAEKARWAGHLLNESHFAENLSSYTDINEVSDNKYLGDLNSPLGINSSSFNHSYTSLIYFTQGYSPVSFGFSSMAQVDYWQNIDPTLSDLSTPYQRLPAVYMDAKFQPDFLRGIKIGAKGDFTYFDHSARYDTGGRFDITPNISYPLETAGSFFIPQASLMYSQYSLSNRAPGYEDNISRAVPIMSVDSGLIFERDIGSQDAPFIQTLEPRLFYTYIPYTDQDNIPIFDTAQYDTSFISLFQENRFIGNDRIGDTNQITAALSTRLLQGHSGSELLNLTVGDIFYFQDRKVTIPSINYYTGELTPGPVETDSFSNIVTQFDGRLSDEWSFQTGMQWNTNYGDIDRGNAALRYRDETSHVFNASYRYRRDPYTTTNDLLHLADFSMRLPITDEWNMIGR